MATYEGSSGIAQLKAKIALKSKMLVGESLEKINTHMVDESVVGAKYYLAANGTAGVVNDQGDFKNSWNVGIGQADKSIREADTSGAGAIANGIVKGKMYNLQENNYVTNNVDHADLVEDGWKDNPEYGWKAKDGYHVVASNIGAAEAILEVVADKVSKL